MTRTGTLAIAVTLVALLSLAVCEREQTQDGLGTAGEVRVIAAGGGGTTPTSSGGASPAARPTAPTAESAVEARITAAAGAQGVVLRNVREVPGEGVACGEVASTSHFRRFVWLDQLGMLATDDGSADFARLTQLCSGAPLASLTDRQD